MTQKQSTVFDICCILGLFLFLILPMLGMFMTPDATRFKRIERRQPAPAPSISIRFDKESQLFEKWFNDRVAFRFELIRMMTRLYRALGVSSKPDRVIIGKDDWLFLGDQSCDAVTQHRRLDRADRGDVPKAVNFFVTLRDALREKDIPFILLVAPDKHTIYPEKLPGWAQHGIKAPSRLDLIRDNLLDREVIVVDPTKRLQQNKSPEQILYFPGGTHWNSVGGFYAFMETVPHLQRFLDIPRAVVNDNISYHTTPGDNTLYVWLEYPKSFYRKDNQPWFDSVSRKQMIKRYLGQKAPEDIRITRKVRVRQGMEPQRIVNTEIDRRERVLLVRDSFSNFIAPYLHCVIKEVIHIRHSELRRYPVMDLVETYRPDVVIYEIGEKFLKSPLPLREIGYNQPRSR